MERTDEFSILKANYCIHDKRSKVDSNVVEEEMEKHLVSNPFEWYVRHAAYIFRFQLIATTQEGPEILGNRPFESKKNV